MVGRRILTLWIFIALAIAGATFALVHYRAGTRTPPIRYETVKVDQGRIVAKVTATGTLSASLCFEQSYAGTEGDSASSTELYALLSRLAELPVRQDLAVTGSVNQWGEVQAIGGVNEKIEGFFDVCRVRGLTGNQGVLLPTANVRHLILRTDVIEAVAQGQFHLYPIRTIDEGIELLTGVYAGTVEEEGTVNGLVNRRLRDLATELKAFAVGSPGTEPKKTAGDADGQGEMQTVTSKSGRGTAKVHTLLAD